MTILIFGTGALGGFLGGLLAKNQTVYFVGRGKQLSAIQSKGLRVQPLHQSPFKIKVNISTHPPENIKFDLIIFAVKTYDIPDAIRIIRPVVQSSTAVFSVQNGIDISGILKSAFNHSPIFAGVSWINTAVVSPGFVQQRFPGSLIFGEWNSKRYSKLGRKIKDIFRDSGIESRITGRILNEIWKKFIFITAVNGVTALTGNPVGKILEQDDTRRIFIDVLKETNEIGYQMAEINRHTVDDILNYLQNEIPPEILNSIRGSMYFDRKAGKPLELETLNGWVVEQGEKMGIPTPANRKIVEVLRPFQAGSQGFK